MVIIKDIVVDKDGIARFTEVGASEQNQASAIAVIVESHH